MLYVKLSPHGSLAWSWCMTYRTYLKPLRETDGLSGPEAIPHCCCGEFAYQAEKLQESTQGKSHQQWSCCLAVPSRWVSVQVLLREAYMIARGKGLQTQPKQNIFGVQRLPPTYTVHSVLTRFIALTVTHQVADMGDSWAFHSLLNLQWLFSSQILVLWSACGVCTGDLQLWPWADHICQLRVQKNNAAINKHHFLSICDGRDGTTDPFGSITNLKPHKLVVNLLSKGGDFMPALLCTNHGNGCILLTTCFNWNIY